MMRQQCFVVGLGGELYGLPLAQVDEVVRAARLVRIPQAPPALAGALVLRGVAVPVLDLRARFGVPARPIEPGQFFVVGSIATKRAGLVVDQVDGLVTVDTEGASGESVPRPLYVKGVATDGAGRRILLLDLDDVLSAREANEITHGMASLDEPE